MKKLLSLSLFLALHACVIAQCEESMKAAENAMGKAFITNPQFIMGQLSSGDSLSFESSWLANNTYRIATSSNDKQPVVIRLYDQNNNLIFTGSDFEYPEKWDFFMEHSMKVRCVIRPVNNPPAPFCLTVLTGFKK
jgi:hypothetical protein